ncbi:MAG: hypothetical protein UR51_C0002G0043 [Candidatus Moranbacteria bacterium GW2011_GWF1_34_10]|nr:MAG: hypothetical protein UR51_C0002G0043 [Candidatus Moranbacteria bacterium GW2011_GWF1_34_10]
MQNEQEKSPTENKEQINQPTNEAEINIKKKTSLWVWIIGGCLIITLLTMSMIIFVGYWGYKKAKNELQNQNPNIEKFKNDMEEAAKEIEEWEKKSKELRNAIPDSENLTYPSPSKEDNPILLN